VADHRVVPRSVEAVLALMEGRAALVEGAAPALSVALVEQVEQVARAAWAVAQAVAAQEAAVVLAEQGADRTKA